MGSGHRGGVLGVHCKWFGRFPSRFQVKSETAVFAMADHNVANLLLMSQKGGFAFKNQTDGQAFEKTIV